MELVPEHPHTFPSEPPGELVRPLGLALWRALATIYRWAEPARTRGLNLVLEAHTVDLNTVAASVPELSEPLVIFTHLDREPGRIERTALIRACQQVEAWAERSGFAETQLHFAEASAAISSEPELAERAARACRAAGQRRRAELWDDCAAGLSRESLGLELWRAVANVRLWAETPRPQRADLFIRARNSDEAGQRKREATLQAPELAQALDTFASLIRDPGVIDDASLVAACQQVASWAERRGLAETHVQFTEAAAAVLSEDPELANLAGRACREAGRRGRAELWYDRAIALSRHIPGKRGVRENIHAHLGFATTLLEIEEYGKALRHIKTAASTAKTKGMRAKAAEAFHDAMYHASMIGELSKAAVLARTAMRVYPYHHVRYPALAHDVAVLMVYFGMYSRALSVLQSAIRRIDSPSAQTLVVSSLARAAAGAGRHARFREAVEKVNTLAPSYGQIGAAAFYNVAEGARLIEDWDMAEDYATRAAQQGRATGAVLIVNRAQNLLTEITERKPGEPELPASDPRGIILRRLAPALRLRVKKWRGPTWRPRHAAPGAIEAS